MRDYHSLPSEERPTLLTCESCGGDGRVEQPGRRAGSYSMLACQWCDGIGFFSVKRREAYRRWKRIKAHHVASGKCG